ncbi:MAG: hypothetical protein HY689_16370 [Chloroflexi bacterium]|nr:hypothetical protein [Chloroflexota bacterium]
MAQRVLGIRWQRAGKVCYVDPVGLGLAPGDRVVVASEGGPQVGLVVIAPQQVVASEVTGPLPPVLRKATPDDLT